MPHSTLKTSLGALTESFVDSVMDAIREATLEDLLQRGRRFPRVAPEERAAATVAVPSPRRRRARIQAQPAAAASHVVDLAPPESAAEITDPQMLLGLGSPDEPLVEVSESPSEQDAPAGAPRPSDNGSHVRLRDNETVARVSGAGVVIRRVR